ncbi:MAG: L(+)-tartrate dehydratase subunit alpha [Treponema sp.]|jgi:L(+)-tartrate dehydratase alpha subunit|nr:L(+)-tartrate dehydratase subunit alpha [Treponema sp.]
MTGQAEKLCALIEAFAGLSARRLPDDVLERLRVLRAAEDSPAAKRIYDAMFEDLDLAERLGRPCCQDTGVPQFFVRSGAAFPLLGELEGCLREGIRRATASVPLRPNVMECFDERNTGDNTGKRIPWVDWELLPRRDDAEIYLYLAGGGCSLPGFARVFMPLEGYGGAVKAVADQIASRGINACPPLLAGIGFGGSVDTAAKLSKKALLRPVGERNGNPRAAELETRLEDALNGIGIGPGGFGGRGSVLAVHIEEAGRHTAALAAALSTGCWAHRRSLLRLRADLSYELPFHKGASLKTEGP